MKQCRTILIVDDEKHGREMLGRLLASSDYNLVFAGNGPEALTEAVQSIPDLILLDVMMPEMDGYEVCRRLRADPLLAEVPVLLVTALNDRDSRLAGLKAGADDFVTKPFDPLELRTRIETIMRLDRYRRLLVERLKFERVVDKAENGYLIIDENNNILYANPKARLYLGLPVDKDSPVRENFLNLVKKQYLCEPHASWATWPNLPGEASPCYLIRPESPNSNPFWLEVGLVTLPPGSKETHRIVHLNDITQRMGLQRDMNSFHAMVSHKLRTPLIGMFSSLELLAGYSAKLSTEEVGEIAQTALKGVKRLQGQIDDILDYLNMSSAARAAQRLETGQIETMVAEFGTNLGLNSISLSIQDELYERRILFSKQNMTLVLWEVLENAKKFHPDQQPNLEIKLRQVNPYEASICIIDDGVHLSPDQLTQVWTPYYQGEKLFTGEIEGMGLGLSMAATVVWGAGGACHIYNRHDKAGLVVEFILPLDRALSQANGDFK